MTRKEGSERTENDLVSDAGKGKRELERESKRIPSDLELINELHHFDLSGCVTADGEQKWMFVTQETAWAWVLIHIKMLRAYFSWLCNIMNILLYAYVIIECVFRHNNKVIA